MTLNIETSNEAIWNKLPFSFPCVCLYTKLEILILTFYLCLKARKRFSYILPANESLSRSMAFS